MTVNPDQTDSASRDVARIHRVLTQAIREWTGAEHSAQCEERLLSHVRDEMVRLHDSGNFAPSEIPQVDAAVQIVRDHQQTASHTVAVLGMAVMSALTQLGRTPLAVELGRLAQSTMQRLAESDPANAAWQRDLAVSHYKLAMFARQSGDDAGYEAELRECFLVLNGMKQRSLHFDPQMAQVYQQLARMFGG